MSLERAQACQADVLLVGVDGGASGYRAHEVVVREGAAGLRLALGLHSAAERIEELAEFQPLAIEIQREQQHSGHFQFSRAESRLQARWIHAASRAIRRLASQRGCERIWAGVCTPGLKTADGRGIAVALNAPRIPDYCDALEQSLSLEGLKLAEPIGRLHSDGLACAWGEELAEDGCFFDCAHAYYVGGGSGVAEGYKLRGRIFGADQLERWVQRAWQTIADDGRSFEVALSARGINRDFRERAPEHDAALLGEDAAAAGDARATSLFEERARLLAQWCGSRLLAIRESQGLILERIVIGQRLGQFFLDPRLQDCFAQPAREALSTLLAECGAPDLRTAWLRGAELAPGRLVGSSLRAAPALGAMALAIEGSYGMGGGFQISDWAMVVGLFALTTWIGHRMSGKPATIREFFLGGKRLPWYAVAGSIIATEISAVTLISLPATVFKDGGNLSYLQLGIIGSFIARWLVALFVVPAYYEREIYSPYDYMGARLGEGVRRTTTLLFTVGGVLGQAARVYLTAVVLEVILHAELARWSEFSGLSPIALAVSAIGIVSVLWTWMGGVATVIWTDVVLFVVFLLAILIALGTGFSHVDGGFSQVMAVGGDAGKLRFFDLSTRLADDYTLWAALIAQGLGGLGTYGTDQLMAQRIFCCKDKRDAQKAIIASYGAMAVTVSVGLIGLMLYAYYGQHPLAGGELLAYKEKNDRIFPIFITTVIESPWRGLIVAGAFAAAISSLDSILAALSQTTLSAFYRPAADADQARAERRAVFVSRVLVLFYGVLLCVIAVQCEQLVAKYGSILNLALAMPGYTQGAVLGAFVLAFLPLKLRGDGYPWAAAIAVLTIIGLAWPTSLAETLVRAACILAFVYWIVTRLALGPGWTNPLEWARTLLFALALLGVSTLHSWAPQVSWVWYVLLGGILAASFGWALDRGAAREQRSLPAR